MSDKDRKMRKKFLGSCESDEAFEIEERILNELEKVMEEKRLASKEINVTAILAGVANALLTIAVRMQADKTSFFKLMSRGWDVYERIEAEEHDQHNELKGRLH